MKIEMKEIRRRTPFTQKNTRLSLENSIGLKPS